MNKLSITEILEMTETIAIACGWQCKKDDEEVWVYPVKEDPGCGWYFNPYEDWNDWHLACDTLKVYLIFFEENGVWFCHLESDKCKNIKQRSHEDKRISAFKMLHDIAVNKIEGEKNA